MPMTCRASNPYQKKGLSCGNCQSMQNAKNNVSPFTQKIMSAKLLRFKQMQNQISEMSLKINELLAENKILKTLQRRQDNALRKYEGSKEQLPQMIKSHNEEVRVINMKFKQLKIAHRELENKLKQRDSELMNLREQHSHLLELSRNKHLCEREQLTKKLASLEQYSKEQNEKIVTLMRKLELQEKNFKHQLQIEAQKHRDTQSQLLNARQINNSLRLKEVQQGKEKVLSPHKRGPDLNYDGFVHRSRASLPSPARAVVVETQRSAVSEMTTKSSFGNSNQEQEDEESDSAPEERSNIKVSVKKAVGGKIKLHRRQLKPPISASSLSMRRNSTVQSPPTTTDGADIKIGGVQSKIPGRVSVSLNPNDDEVPPKSAIGPSQNERSPGLSPRFSQEFIRTGISIPSDLTIGNAARMRAVVEPSSSEDSEASEDEMEDRPDQRESERRSDDESGDDYVSKTSTTATNARTRTEEDIDKIISKACDDMLASDLDHETLVNGMGNFSLTEELNQLKDLSWDELQKQIKPMREEMTRKIEKTMPLEKTDYTLDSHEKNHLLKALNMIDEESKPEIDKFINGDDFSPSVEPGRVRQMFAQNRKKVDLMKSLFGTDVDPISVTDGIN
uniref:Lebercilin n=1 Tax=Lygus hesperus TaxID=30085 RepID=A0A146KR55_LYGHE